MSGLRVYSLAAQAVSQGGADAVHGIILQAARGITMRKTTREPEK